MFYIYTYAYIRIDICIYKACMCAVLHVRLFVTLWTRACQAPLSLGFSRQEYWSELLCPLLADLPDPRIEPVFLTSPALAGEFFITSTTGKLDITEDINIIVVLFWDECFL